jgi:hypothetical protein
MPDLITIWSKPDMHFGATDWLKTRWLETTLSNICGIERRHRDSGPTSPHISLNSRMDFSNPLRKLAQVTHY